MEYYFCIKFCEIPSTLPPVTAQEKLSCLQRELLQTEGQLNQATEELQKISEVAPGRPLTEDDKQDLRNMLGRKMDKVGRGYIRRGFCQWLTPHVLDIQIPPKVLTRRIIVRIV